MTGLNTWVYQRLSGVILLVALIGMGLKINHYDSLTWSNWMTLLQDACSQWLIIAGFLALCVHAWIGMWTIGTDYLAGRMCKNIYLWAVALILMGSALSVLLTLWSIK